MTAFRWPNNNLRLGRDEIVLKVRYALGTKQLKHVLVRLARLERSTSLANVAQIYRVPFEPMIDVVTLACVCLRVTTRAVFHVIAFVRMSGTFVRQWDEIDQEDKVVVFFFLG